MIGSGGVNENRQRDAKPDHGDEGQSSTNERYWSTAELEPSVGEKTSYQPGENQVKREKGFNDGANDSHIPEVKG